MSNFQPPLSVQSILKTRYFQQGEDWEGLCRRVSSTCALIEKEEDQPFWNEKFYDLLSSAKGLLNTPALINAGAKHKGCVAACFSFRPEDSMESILENGRLAAWTLKFGGGVGFELSRLRPEGSIVNSTHKVAMGPIGVLKYYCGVGNMVTQGGIRPAAMIAILRIDHPDIIKFCLAKNTDKDLSNFNISVSIPDSFMKKLNTNPEKPHICIFSGKQYNVFPDGKSILKGDRGSQKVLSVQEVYDILCQSASVNGDPGVFFVDHVNRNNPLIANINDQDNEFYMAGANPCSEIGLSHAESCILGSIDLNKFIKDGQLNYEDLQNAFSTMTRFLDNLIDTSYWPDPLIEKKTKSLRRIGVGVMGFASLLDKLGIRYGSEESINLAKEIGKVREAGTKEASAKLGEIRGVYPAAREGEIYRNVSRTTIPPTGSLAMIANTSWSIEPHLYWAFEERRNNQVRMRFLPAVEEYISSARLEELVEQAEGNLLTLNNLIQADLPDHMILAKNVTPEEHLLVLAAWQESTESAISKTICIPSELLTPEKVSDIFKFAWENKIKGMTVYPEGSRDGEPMSLGKKKIKIKKSLPQSLKSDRHEFEVYLGDRMRKTFCFVGLDPEDGISPIEVFLKHPYVQDPMAIQFIDLTTRLLSLALRYRKCSECGEEIIPLGNIIKQLRETDGQSMFSVPGIFVKALAKYLEEGESVGKCPSPGCEGTLTLVEGCEQCLTCGYRACS